MKVLNRKVFLAKTGFMVAIMLTGITACGKKTENHPETKETVQNVTEEKTQEGSQEQKKVFEVEQWGSLQAEERTDVSFSKMNESYVEGVMAMKLEIVSEYAVYIDASGSTIDEFGIFKAKEGEEDEVKKQLQAYLKMRLDTWMEEYMPEEKPKVQKANLHVREGYILYAILGEKDKKQLFESFENCVQ